MAASAASPPARAQAFGIESPRAGTVFALDPEIPQAAQRIVFRGAPGEWVLDGQSLGHGARIEWLPRPGRHRLERRDAAASERIEFEVRTPPAITSPSPARAAKTAPKLAATEGSKGQ